MSDIVERLNQRSDVFGSSIYKGAADEILRLRAENEKLRSALKPLAQHAPTHEYSQPETPVVIRVLVKDLRTAAALKETGDEQASI